MKNKKLLKLREQIRADLILIAETRLDAMNAKNKKLDNDCRLLFDSMQALLYFTVSMIDKHKTK